MRDVNEVWLVWRASFIVRLVRDRRGQVSGVIERAATGAKEAFQGVEAVGRVIAGMVEREGAGAPRSAKLPPGRAGTAVLLGRDPRGE